MVRVDKGSGPVGGGNMRRYDLYFFGCTKILFHFHMRSVSLFDLILDVEVGVGLHLFVDIGPQISAAV